MKIVTCYKCVPDVDSIGVMPNGTLDLSTAQWEIGQYDLNAVEAGVKLAEATGGEVQALTAGDDIVNNSKLRKAILSRGPMAMYGICDEAMKEADSLKTAYALKAGIEKIGGVDLVLCGEGSSDFYSQQVGALLGSLLNWPTVNAVSNIECIDGRLVVERNLEDGVEVLEVSLPSVICVTADINVPRIPNMKEILASSKKPFAVWSFEDIGLTAQAENEVISILVPEKVDRLKVVLDGDSDENIDELFRHLKALI